MTQPTDVNHPLPNLLDDEDVRVRIRDEWSHLRIAQINSPKTHIHTCTRTHAHTQHTHTRTHAHTCTHTHAHTQHTRARAHTHTHTHTHTQGTLTQPHLWLQTEGVFNIRDLQEDKNLPTNIVPAVLGYRLY